MDFSNILRRETEELKSKRKIYQKWIDEGVDGRLNVFQNKNHLETYIIVDGKRRYAKKSDAELILKIKKKKYGNRFCDLIDSNLSAYNQCLSNITNIDFNPNSLQLGKAYVLTGEELDKLTRKDKFEYFEDKLIIQSENRAYPETLRHKTNRGLIVRSKSEVIIATCLDNFNLNYRYEKQLTLYDYMSNTASTNIYPDFTIHVNGKSIIWEHFGMMDNKQYVDDFKRKMETYYWNRILPGKNLIITMDGPDGSIDMATVYKTAKHLLDE